MRDQKTAHNMTRGWRRIPQPICDRKGCAFYGKPAQQGVCFSALSDVERTYIDSVRKRAADYMEEMKSLRQRNKLTTDKAWIKYLESQVECMWMNSEFGLDQLIHLRATVAKLERRLAAKR